MFRLPTPRPVVDKNEKRPYYELFEEYCSWVIWNDKVNQYTLRFLPTIKRAGFWYVYKDGVYELADQSEIDILYFNAMEMFGIHTTTNQLNFCMTKLKAWTRMNITDWKDHESVYENNLDGLWHYATKTLLKHTPKLMYKRQSPRHYFADVVEIPPELIKLLQIFPKQHHRDNFIKFLLMVVHKKIKWGKFLFLYGKTGAGKSTILQIFSALYGKKNSSKTVLSSFGQRFGLDHMYDKRCNVSPDVPTVEINPWVIATMKTLTGNDGDIPIETKGGTKFMYPVQCFIVFGIQELVGFTNEAEKEIDSWMKRVVLGECPNMQEEDEEFNESILDPDLLDRIYSWALNTTPQRFYEPGKEKEWIRENKEEWLLKSNPILAILKENYEYCATDITETDEGIKAPITQSILCFEVEKVVTAALKEEGNLVPKQLRNAITRAFNVMFIGRSDRRGSNASWENVVEKRRDEV